MNWIEIDKYILSLIKIAKSKEVLYNEVKNKFRWSDSQTEAAIAPILRKLPDVEKEWSTGANTIQNLEKGTQKKKLKKR